MKLHLLEKAMNKVNREVRMERLRLGSNAKHFSTRWLMLPASARFGCCLALRSSRGRGPSGGPLPGLPLPPGRAGGRGQVVQGFGGAHFLTWIWVGIILTWLMQTRIVGATSAQHVRRACAGGRALGPEPIRPAGRPPPARSRRPTGRERQIGATRSATVSLLGFSFNLPLGG